MALVIGTNCGFVETAPTTDPTGGTIQNWDGLACATKFTSPSGDWTLTEIGIWMASGGNQTVGIDFGIYANDSDGSEPGTLLANATGTADNSSAYWLVLDGLSYDLTASTVYWLAVQCDIDSGTKQFDRESNAGAGTANINPSTALPADWTGLSTFTDTNDLHGIYGLIEATAGGGGGDTGNPLITKEILRVGGEYITADLPKDVTRKY